MPKTLLLADDSVVIQKLVGLSFANEDVELFTTDNGDDAVAKAREISPDVVLADVVMPGMSGYEVCEAIKSDPALSRTPVLLLTGTFEAFDESRAQQVGSDGHITKPFEAQALVDRVNELLAQGRSTTAAAASADDGFDIFDEGSSSVLETPGTDVTRASTLDASPLPTEPSAQSTPTAMPGESGFDLGGDTPELPPLDDADLLDDSLDIGDQEVGDHTVAFMPETPAPNLESQVTEQDSPTRTAFSVGDSDLGPVDDLMDSASPDPLASSSPIPPASTSEAEANWPAESPVEPFGSAPPPIPADDPLAGAGDSDPSLTTIIMSDGENSSDGIQIGDEPAPVRSLDDDALLGSAEAIAPSMAATPEPSDPSQTILADDLFDDAPAAPAQAIPVENSVSMEDDVFDFGSTDPLAASSDNLIVSPPVTPSVNEPPAVPALADDYDVSSSDLGSSYSPLAAPEESPADSIPSIPDMPLELAENDGLSLSDGLLGEPVPMLMGDADVDPELDPMGDAGPIRPHAEGTGTPDITPVMRDRIHETLERVAWEAFADLSETMVKQVLERVESIAWEVIPQMAEALVKEEIRRMKGDGEDD